MSRQDREEKKGGPERYLEETAFAPVIPTLSLVQYRSFSILAPTDDSIEPILEFLVNPKQDAPVNFESRS